MKLLIVRHADPDYSIDSLTEKGWREAAYLSERLAKLEVKRFYVSPLGRAKDTASLTLESWAGRRRSARGCRNLTRRSSARTRRAARRSRGTGCPRTGRRTHGFTVWTSGICQRLWRTGM